MSAMLLRLLSHPQASSRCSRFILLFHACWFFCQELLEPTSLLSCLVIYFNVLLLHKIKRRTSQRRGKMADQVLHRAAWRSGAILHCFIVHELRLLIVSRAALKITRLGKNVVPRFMNGFHLRTCLYLYERVYFALLTCPIGYKF